MAVRDTTAPTLTSLSLPPVIYYEYQNPYARVSIGAFDTGGAGFDHAEVILDRTFAQSTPGVEPFQNKITFLPESFSADGSGGGGYITLGNVNPGIYNVTGVAIYDRQGNTRIYSTAEVQALGGSTSFEVQTKYPSGDSTPPLLNGLDLPGRVDLTTGTQVTNFYGQATESLSRLRLHLDHSIATTAGVTSDIVFTNLSSDFYGQTSITQATAAGTYNITSAELVDTHGNGTTLTGAQLVAMGIESSFTVISPTQRESVAPVLTGLTVTNPDITNLGREGGVLQFAVTANDASGFDRAVIHFDHSVYASIPYAGNRVVSEITLPGGTGRFNLVEGTARGDYAITSVEVFDLQGNSRVYGTSDLAAIGAATGFTVIERVVDGTAGNDVLTGSDLSDQIFGLAGDDVLNGLAGDDRLSGDDGDDFLNGGAGADQLTGGAGNDLLDGGTGYDYMFGGAGNDTYYVDNFQDALLEGTDGGFDTVYASVSYRLTAATNYDDGTSLQVERLIAVDGANPLAINLTGSRTFQEIVGNGAANLLDSGGGGGDRLYGFGGDDTLIGDDGDNVLDGGTGADRMQGGRGGDSYYVDNPGDVVVEAAPPQLRPGEPVPAPTRDTVFASIDYTLPAQVEDLILVGSVNRGNGNDLGNVIYGNATNNVIFGYAGADTLYGLAGDDGIDAGDGDDGVIGGLGNDYIDGGAGNDFLFGGDGADTILGGDGNDNIFGDDGDDGIQGGAGGDRIEGGAGADYLFGNDGDDLVIGGAGNDNVYGGIGGDLIGGGAGDDRLFGEAGADILYGEDGDDRLEGGDGSDRLYGGAGRDLIDGGEGDDLVSGEGGDDSIGAGAGNDILGGGDGNDFLSGGAGNDAIVGDAGRDELYGGDGNDLLVGGLGNDMLQGDAGNDTFLFNVQPGTANVDGIADFTTGQDAIVLDHLAFGGLALGGLSTDNFAVGFAKDANDYIVFDQARFTLMYDADGSGAGAAVAFATVTQNITAADIIVV